MKNIIIWGVPRCGKGTLSDRIVRKFGHNWIPLDAVREYTKEVLGGKCPRESRPHVMAPAIVRFIDNLKYITKQYGQHFIIEGCDFDMEGIFPKIDKGQWVVIAMGYPDMTVREKVDEVAKYENENDWTHGLDVNKKTALCERFIAESRSIKETAERIGVKFFDCADRERALEDAFQYIVFLMT